MEKIFPLLQNHFTQKRNREPVITHPVTPNPAPAENNPGRHPQFTISFERENDSPWQEHLDLPVLLGDLLRQAGHDSITKDHWLHLSNGMMLLPQMMNFHLTEDGFAETSTTIEIRDTAGNLSGMFEFQHARSDETATDAFRIGFETWLRTDFIALQDALRSDPEHCQWMNMDFAGGNQAAEPRRIIFGPTEQFAAQETDPETTAQDPHPFCPCCLFTNTMNEFTSLLKAKGTFAVRLYAARNSQGEIMADCRINGEDFEPGQQALLAYAAQWPERGMEYRKQLVVIQPGGI